MIQADVFFARGNRAYWLSEVPPGSDRETPGNVVSSQLIEAPQELACELAGAGCARAPRLPTLTRAGYAAIQVLVLAGESLPEFPTSQAAARFDGACGQISQHDDSQTRTIETVCEALERFITDGASQNCGSTECRLEQWEAVAGDIRAGASALGQLERELTPGPCLEALNGQRTYDAQTASALHGYVVAVRDRDADAAERSRLMLGRLSQQRDWFGMTQVSALRACAPSSASRAGSAA